MGGSKEMRENSESVEEREKIGCEGEKQEVKRRFKSKRQ